MGHRKISIGLSQSIKSIDWDEESFPAYADFSLLPVFALFFLAVRYLLDNFVFEKVGRRLIFRKEEQNVDEETDDRRKTIRKFKESAWKFIYFLSEELLLLSVIYDEPWFTNTKFFWMGPGDKIFPDLTIKLKMKAVYMYAAGFSAYSIYALIFWETRRSDFGVLMCHHIATVILIVLSYIVRATRVGSVILALHDASDIFLEIEKMSKYCGADILAIFALVLFALSWILLRLIYYPFWVIWSTSYEVIQISGLENHKMNSPFFYYVCNTLLNCLLVLHIYWSVLIYRMAVRAIQARGQIGEDIRSESDEEEEHEA